LSSGDLAQRIEQFAGAIPYPPEDLDPQALLQRLVILYLPMWLVDGDVRATWEAETGYNYQVVSHQERYADGAGWATREVQETRVRWEPRVGRLTRHYDNLAAPALETHPQLWQALGGYDLSQASAPDAARMASGLVRLPDRPRESAWSEAQLAFREAAAAECRLAATADHIRAFRWEPEFSQSTWTLLWLPVLSSVYRDDQGILRPILINGQNGRVVGVRRASMQRAQRLSLLLAAIAAGLIAIAVALTLLGAAVPPLLLAGLALGVGGIALGVGALVPIYRAWQFNRRQASVDKPFR